MNLGTKKFLLIVFILFSAHQFSYKEDFIREAAIKNGFKEISTLNPIVNSDLAEIGKNFFSSDNLSLNSNISCQKCHLDKFGSSDGISNAVGVFGEGEGDERLKSKGAIIPRNTLALWGRGSKGFDVLFWDGRAMKIQNKIISPFGNENPSDDLLEVAIHLPAVEIREMIIEDKFILDNKKEEAGTAMKVYSEIVSFLWKTEKESMTKLASFYNLDKSLIDFGHVAKSISEFMKKKFALQNTKFHNFIFHGGKLSEEEISGAELFYGKGKCASCHSGSYFTDFKFYSIPFPQKGFGKNGFGIDYGKYNISHDPSDLYKFKTSSLLDVANTSPYSHSGSVKDLSDAIIYHFDPLKFGFPKDKLKRAEFYKILSLSAQNIYTIGFLNESEVRDLEKFLQTLSYKAVLN